MDALLKTLSNMAVFLSEDIIIEMLEKAINQWKKDPTYENFSKIDMYAMLIGLKNVQHQMNEDNPFKASAKLHEDLGNIEDIIKMMERMNGDHLDKSKN